MKWLEKIIRPELLGLKGYVSARAQAGGAVVSIALDANESPWLPFGSMAACCGSNRYPEPQPYELIGRLAGLYGVETERMLMTRGSDEGIDLLIRLCCRAGVDEIMICPPTFTMYQAYAAVQNAGVCSVPLGDKGQLDVSAILSACKPTTKIIFIPTPNAPMGHIMRSEDIINLCRERAEQSLIVADEAYIEFTDSPEGLTKYIDEFPNLVVLRTLSKAHALAGERIGTVICRIELVQALLAIRAPYALTQSSIKVAMDALSPIGLIQNLERRRVLKAERDRLKKLLPKSPMIRSVFPSVTNFFLIQVEDARVVTKELQRFSIRARPNVCAIPETIRISLGTPEENDVLLTALGVELPVGYKGKQERLASVQRNTNETKIDVTVNLDAPNFLEVNTGIEFFDHMLSQIATHGGFGLALVCKGDLKTDQHHTIEDCALTLGDAIKKALGEKRGIARYGFTTPLDEALAQVVIDLSGRPFSEFVGALPSSLAGEMDCEMVPHFFRSIATALGASIHVEVKGTNTHHMVEACFKAMGRALRQAIVCEGKALPSTKGTL